MAIFESINKNLKNLSEDELIALGAQINQERNRRMQNHINDITKKIIEDLSDLETYVTNVCVDVTSDGYEESVAVDIHDLTVAFQDLIRYL